MPMKQQSLAMAAGQSGYEQYRKPTRRDEFLKVMEAIVPWAALCEVIEPHYPKAGNGRPPIGLERMLRIHFIQHWFNLADLACEEALYDSARLRRFVGIDLGCEPAPDATTLLKFRRLLNDHKLGEALFAKVGQELQARGFKVNTGTIVDATIIGAPSSTKNADKARDPEMHQSKKGKQWYFGSATCKSHGFLFHRRTYELMKPVVPPTVPYLDMRCWQRRGVKLQGQRTLRFTRCIKLRGEMNSASTTAERG